MVLFSIQFNWCKCHIVNFKRGGLFIDSPDWINKKKATINPKNTYDKRLQYAVTVTLNYDEIKWNPQRVSNIKPIRNKYNWKGINDLPKIGKRFEKNNPAIALNILYVKEKEKYPVYISKQ